jgi:hypothetical protein
MGTVSKAGRQLKAGDEALTDFNGRGLTLVKIVDRAEGRNSQSGICYRVTPNLKGCDKQSWIDADWFDPAPAALL